MENTNQISAAGCIIVAKDTRRVLFALRNKANTKRAGWGIWGGKIENGETTIDGLRRELHEEIGKVPTALKVHPFDIYQGADSNFFYYTYVWIIPNEFTPILNDEHISYAWVNIGQWPTPLHKGVAHTLRPKKNIKKLHQMIDEAPEYPTYPCISNTFYKSSVQAA